MNEKQTTHSSFFPAETGKAKALICAAQMQKSLQMPEKNVMYISSPITL